MLGADNQQETFKAPKFFYYTGFCVGELTCSVIRAKDKRGRGFYFMPDLTISNADLNLLKEINRIIASNLGNIGLIKGVYNLKFRDKKKVEKIFHFLNIISLI